MAGNFQHPFHCVRYVDRQSTGSQVFLIASSGPWIYSYAAESGQRLAIWPRGVDSSGTSETQEPPEKKRRVSNSEAPVSEDSKPAGEDSGKSPVSIAWSNIPLLVASSSGKHVVALTAEDKCIRVFLVGDNGALEQLSARNMPKRPSTIVLASNDNTILCGDKFGDVYSLPLIPGEKPTATVLPSRTSAQARSQPAATALTVHSKKNLQALEQQKRQWNEGYRPEEKTGPAFENQVLLGHVSLLTDLIYVSLPDSKRSYILTGDRDEHIRVSRGPPQAHVIENFCLGHTSFISKLCVPEWAPEYLVSGGGDSHLLVWKWMESSILQKVSLADNAPESTEVAVRGIWAVFLGTTKVILVGLEGSSQLLCYVLEPTGTLKSQSPIQLSGNVLDVTTMGTKEAIVVSVDGVRKAGSTQEWRESTASPQTLLQAFRVKADLEWEPVHELTGAINSQGTSDITAAPEGKQWKELNESTYSMANLRKRTGEDD